MVAVFYLKKNLPETEVNNIKAGLETSPLVESIQFITSEQALEKFNNNFPELREILNNLEINPFPSSLEASLSDKTLDSIEILDFIQKIKSMNGIEDVHFNRDWIEKILSLSRLARAIGLLFGGVLILASFFIISNAIKLNVLARKEEIAILRMVGATNMFIRTPFLLEGVVLGLIGGLFSLFLLFLLTKFFPLYLGSSLGVLGELINFRYLSFSQSLYIVGGGALIGLVGSLSSLSRFLKD